MHLANPPTTLTEAVQQLTERTYQLDAARHDYGAWQARAEKAEGENAKLREALYATTAQLEHVEKARELGLSLPIPATLTPDVIAAARKLL